jgi:hypothetical protein
LIGKNFITLIIMQTESEFEIEIQGLIVKVTGHLINGDEICRMEFSDGRPPLIITEALAGSSLFWTSIPQGRQKEASFFGARIAEKLKNK